ncbi:cadherin-like beta sandwich domain-containing protein [Clostridium sp. BL-8]|uniref:cadherin-like beta sandwich domain-containing protein n=1 Tax=Clostridium sp. BL-8 TaxID=349938 RepID=UPI00098C0D64|nr:cadherin-like beta sandwich domain-containing protein [Clostridium sp. BL-8]OOM68382.1 putative endo-beta-N-acetylglucosaminidase precursor [Clostridium sp. BL-8]
MNRNIKRIIAITLALGTFSVMSPVKYLKFIDSDKIAYASSDDDDLDAAAIEASYLDDLSISGGNADISFSKKKTDYTIKIDKNIESIVVKAKAKDSSDTIKINDDPIDLDSDNVAEKPIELDKGRNLIRIKVVTEDYGLRIYNLVVNRGSADTSDSSDSDVPYLNDIQLSDGNLSFSKNTTSYNVNVDSSVTEMRITAQPEDDDYEVKIDGIKVDKDEDYRRTVELKNGNNAIPIDLVDDDGGEQTYTLNVNRGGTALGTNNAEVEDNSQDPIYLDDIVIQDGSVPLNFKPKVTSYAVDVGDDVDSILFKAAPEFSDDKVAVNGDYSKSSFVRRINLNEGKNVITIKVNNGETYDKGDIDYEERTYTVTVYRGTSQGTSQSNGQGTENTSQAATQQSSASSAVKLSQWVQVNGKWQYNDSTGKPAKNMWVQNYYLQADGNMAINWITYNGSWYYLGSDGAKRTGWQSVNGNWYYLDADGRMQTGWIRDGSGKYYYLNTDGSMAHSTTIDGYKLGTDGAWIN